MFLRPGSLTSHLSERLTIQHRLEHAILCLRLKLELMPLFDRSISAMRRSVLPHRHCNKTPLHVRSGIQEEGYYWKIRCKSYIQKIWPVYFHPHQFRCIDGALPFRQVDQYHYYKRIALFIKPATVPVIAEVAG